MPRCNKGHSLSISSLGCQFFSDEPSAVPVSIGKAGISQTNLIAEDCLSQVLKKSKNTLIMFNVIDNPSRSWLLRQRLQLPLNDFELTGRGSTASANDKLHHTLQPPPGALAPPRRLGATQKVHPSMPHAKQDFRPFSRHYIPTEWSVGQEPKEGVACLPRDPRRRQRSL